MHTGRTPRSPSLRRTWAGVALTLVATIVGLGGVSLASTQYQRAVFNSTTEDLQRQTAALHQLERTLLIVNQRVVPVLYKPTPEERASAHASFVPARKRMDIAFAAAEVELYGTPMQQRLAHARDHWTEFRNGVDDSERLWSDGTVVSAFTQGDDPFGESVWGEAFELTTDLTEIGSQSVAALHEQVQQADRMQDLVGPLVLGAIVVALGVGWLVARRMQRRILGPLVDLRHAAITMRDTDVAEVVAVPGASAELQELATTLNETSMALRASHSRLHAEANTDPLTSLPNRRAFVSALRAMLERPHHEPIGVLFVDLDDFKVVNDSLGHAAGDELLRVVGRRLRTSSREGELVARLGGDEFAIAVTGASSATMLSTVAQRVLSGIQHPVTIGETSVTVRCSIGVAGSEPGAGPAGADELLRNADFAMYMAKGQGKSCFEVFAPSMHNEMLSRLELKRDLAQAAPLGQLRLLYQPVLGLVEGEVLGFEALVRWDHPVRGLLSPAEFIELAEDTGDVVAIGAWVIDEACATLAAMHREEFTSSRPWISVNTSARQLVGMDLLGVIDAALERHGLRPGDLVLEVTESVAMTSTREAGQLLAALRERGVHIALDDFGTGYSSLRWLGELPVDVVKIDRSFVTKQGPAGESMLEAIVALGQQLGLQIIAEGIEQPWELDRLRRLGARAGQGYLFARPMPGPDAVVYEQGDTRAVPHALESATA